MDIDAAGGATTAGLIGSALERPTGHAGETHGECTDCGAATEGNFCSNCGQPTHVHRTLLHLAEEVLHGVVHFDGRIWRTLPLLFLNPGRLTREWIAGKRTRYVSPLAIFLFVVFLMFFAYSFLGHKEDGGTTPMTIDQQIASTQAGLVIARRELAEAQAGLDLAVGEDGKTYTDAAQRAAIAGLERRLDQQKAAKASGQTTIVAGDGWMATLSESVRTGQTKINTGNKDLDKALTKKALNPELALYKIQQTAYKFSFLLVPLSIPFLALLFLWKRGFTLYDHGVFVLYSITAMSILFTAAILIGSLWGPLGVLAGLAVCFGPPVHMYAQLKGAYGLSVFSALWRTAVLQILCIIVVGLFLTTIVMMGLTG
jgi:hypothetical protein